MSNNLLKNSPFLLITTLVFSQFYGFNLKIEQVWDHHYLILKPIKMKVVVLVVLVLLQCQSYAQSDLDRVIKGGEILLGGLAFVKTAYMDPEANSTNVKKITFKNKLGQKIVLRLFNEDDEGNELQEELIISDNGKETLYNLLKGVWRYEIEICEGEIFKKGQFNLEKTTVITLKED